MKEIGTNPRRYLCIRCVGRRPGADAVGIVVRIYNRRGNTFAYAHGCISPSGRTARMGRDSGGLGPRLWCC